MKNKVELLAPAGDWESFLAAAENGADAVYLGGKLFNARQFAGNFDIIQLKSALDYAHVRGVNIYLTMNTLMSDNELIQAMDFVAEVYLMGIDGIIVQDLGLAGLLKKAFPGLSLHASTQMTVYNLAGVRELSRMGFKRAVLARELSIEEIGYISRNTTVEIEVFAHGALCICYSGQCLMSSIIGGRSGNRGKCAQPCRMPYELVKAEGSSGKSITEASNKAYLLSPKDLCSIFELKNLIESGVKSLKIEGRMKNSEYVATVVKTYRKYIDEIYNLTENEKEKDVTVSKEDIRDLTQIFNRGGLSNGYLTGKSGADIMSYEKPKNWGIYLGNVMSYDRASRALKLQLEEDLAIGDGVEIWNGENESPGALVSEIKINNSNKSFAQKGEIVLIGSLNGAIIKGNKVYKTSDKRLNIAAKETFSGKSLKKVALNCKISIKNGHPIYLKVRDLQGNEIETTGENIPQAAVNKPLTEERIIEQISKTGSTPFEFRKIEIELDSNLSLPISEVNNVRRRTLEELEKKRKVVNLRTVPKEYEKTIEDLLYFPGNSRNKTKNLKISVLLYNIDRAVDYSDLSIDRIYLPFAEGNKEENSLILERCRNKGCEVFLWLPSITRGNYERLIKSRMERAVKLDVDGLLVGNIGSVGYSNEYPQLKITGDYTFNVFNGSAFRELVEMNLSGICLSPELTLNQISNLKENMEIQKEAIVYGRIPLMTTEYCPVGSIKGGFSKGSQCNNACLKDIYSLRDRMGVEFPVICDKIDCRTTILNSNVLFIPESIGKIGDAGIDMIRLNITDEGPEEIKKITQMHREICIDGDRAIRKYDKLINKIKDKGFTKGHYFRGV